MKTTNQDSATEEAASSAAPVEPGDPSSQDKDPIIEDQPISSSTTTTTAPSQHQQNQPSMTLALMVYWILPVLCISLYGRYWADTTVPTIPVVDSPRRPRAPSSSQQSPVQQQQQQQQQQQTTKHRPSPQPAQQSPDLLPPSWPTAYRETVEYIQKRRRPIPGFFAGDIHQITKIAAGGSTTSSRNDSNPKSTQKSRSSSTSSNQKKRTTSNRQDGSLRAQFHQTIENLRDEWARHPNDLFRGIALAEAMRYYDLQFHEGGTYEQEAIALYDQVIHLARAQRQGAIETGHDTRQCRDGVIRASIHDEVTLDYPSKSWDGLLCGLYTSQGKLFFMANMFEKAVQAYNHCVDNNNNDDINAPDYLDAVNARGSASLVLGHYESAGRDFWYVVQHDEPQRYFVDAFTGLARVLEAQETALAATVSWEEVVALVYKLVAAYEAALPQTSQKESVAAALHRLHHVLFTYHDVKTQDYPTAFAHLETAFRYKLSILPPWNAGNERRKIEQTKSIFHAGFWNTLSTGSTTRVPIFIVGFPRSGSTLLERILDAHPLAAGTGENSVFNGRLDDIRNQIVQVSSSSSTSSDESLTELTQRLAEEVVDEMRRRWELVQAATHDVASPATDEPAPQRFVDKMLTNYYNIGFIQMLYPNALILHVAREPMDTAFSAYKHEFPPGALDYTSDMTGLAELYTAYRDIMEHWDAVLPGRITHVRYEDLVQDFEGVARAVIAATGLPWNDDVLQFHKKKHAVNTLSSTQVRKGIYQDSLQAWRRYEQELQPLVDKLGETKVTYLLRTTLPKYRASTTTGTSAAQ